VGTDVAATNEGLVRLLYMMVAAGVVLAPVVVPSSAAFAAVNFGAFRTPSGAIGCAYDAASLRCDVAGGIRPLPPRPKSCRLDWGQGFEMGLKGEASVVCAGDTALGGPQVVPYATTWHRPGLLCISSAQGLRCNNTDGHGFFVSKTKSYQF
jgi:hypothetical protein